MIAYPDTSSNEPMENCVAPSLDKFQSIIRSCIGAEYPKDNGRSVGKKNIANRVLKVK